MEASASLLVAGRLLPAGPAQGRGSLEALLVGMSLAPRPGGRATHQTKSGPTL